jgi:two-component system, LytTR family, sensor histidine kinase AlgZ
MADRNRDRSDPPAFAPTGSRPASLWPESQRLSEFRSTAQVLTQFDPLAQDPSTSAGVAAFDVCHPALGLRAVLLVQAVLAVTALSTAEHGADWLARQGASAFGGAAGTVTWLVLLCAIRRWLGSLVPWLRGTLVLGLGAACALAAWWPLWMAGLAGDGAGLRLLGIPLAGAGFAALLWAWLELRARIWQPATASARLAELQSRIRPHFLFNALNTAVALVRVDPARAEAVLEDLAELFRVALAETGVSVTLADEVGLAKRYLAIEQVRFGGRLQVSWSLDPRADAARLPPLVLQPLVENAVRHGVEPALDGGRIRVEVQARRGQAVLTVHNTVSDEPSSPGNGMALRNVRERLRLLHDVGGQCDTWRDAEGFHARLTVPLS